MGTLCRERDCKVKRKRKFQRMAVERMRNCEDVGALARELGSPRDASTSGGRNSIWWSLEKSRLDPARTNRPTVNKPSN
jgi:hypothetical protein